MTQFHLPFLLQKQGDSSKRERPLFVITAVRRFFSAQKLIKCPESGHVTLMEPLHKDVYLCAYVQASTNPCTGVSYIHTEHHGAH